MLISKAQNNECELKHFKNNTSCEMHTVYILKKINNKIQEFQSTKLTMQI